MPATLRDSAVVADEGAPEEGINLQIIVTPDVRPGVWANFAQVSHSPYEFTLDFSRLEFDGEKPLAGVLVSRVSLSPLFVQQLIDALQGNYKVWAERAMPPEVRDV